MTSVARAAVEWSRLRKAETAAEIRAESDKRARAQKELEELEKKLGAPAVRLLTRISAIGRTRASYESFEVAITLGKQNVAGARAVLERELIKVLLSSAQKILVLLADRTTGIITDLTFTSYPVDSTKFFDKSLIAVVLQQHGVLHTIYPRPEPLTTSLSSVDVKAIASEAQPLYQQLWKMPQFNAGPDWYAMALESRNASVTWVERSMRGAYSVQTMRAERGLDIREGNSRMPEKQTKVATEKIGEWLNGRIRSELDGSLQTTFVAGAGPTLPVAVHMLDHRSLRFVRMTPSADGTLVLEAAREKVKSTANAKTTDQLLALAPFRETELFANRETCGQGGQGVQ